MPSFKKNTLENLLRPAWEWASATAMLLIAVAFYAVAHALGVPHRLIMIVFLVLFSMAFGQLYKASIIWRYQRGLRHRSPYHLPAHLIKRSEQRVFLGRGFHWQPCHTQRLRELDLPQFQRYRAPFHSVADKPHRFTKTLPDTGGDKALHGVGFKDRPIYLPLAHRQGHTLVLGTTGVGKTRFAELLITQDILRGDTVIVIDPKGDVELLRHLVSTAKTAGRLGKLRVLHLGFPALSSTYNPIGQFEDVSEVAHRVTQSLPSSGNSAAFKAFAWQFVDIIAQALHRMDERPTYRKIAYYLVQRDALLTAFLERYFLPNTIAAGEWVSAYQTIAQSEGKTVTTAQAFKAYTQAHEQTCPVLDGLLRLVSYETTYYDKITASLLPLLNKLTTERLSALLSPETADKSLDWATVIANQQIVYVGLDALSNSTVAGAVGNALLADLVSLAGRLYKEDTSTTPLPRICLHVDEFNEIIGDEFIPLLNKARGVGFQVTAYTQTWSDVEARLNSRPKAEQVSGNFNTLVMFRVKDVKTAEQLLAGLPFVPFKTRLPVTKQQLMPSVVKGAPPHLTALADEQLQVQTVPLLTPPAVLHLPKGEAFALLEGGRLIKLQIPIMLFSDSNIPRGMPALMGWLATQSKHTKT